MPPAIPPDLLPRARQIILPLVGTEDEREALLTEAFYLYDPLLYGIERNGAPKVFAIRCIKKLLDYGCLPEGEHSLARLLETARYDCGVDKHGEINELVTLTNVLCLDTNSKATNPPLPPVSKSEGIQTIATPQPERTPTVFISYSHADETFAQQLITDLNAAGHACWVDTSAIKGGDEWIMTIAEGIINSYAFVPVVTLKALQSRWVQDEILWAKNKNKLIIPVILENVLDHTRFFPLVSYQGITLFEGDYNLALPKLLSYLPSPILPEVELSNEEVEDDETTEAGTILTAPSIPRTLELAYLERLKLEELLNTEKYTALGGTAQLQRKPEMRAVFELVKFGRNETHEHSQEVRRFENAVEEIRAIRRCVLLGEPGGGKTTAIWKLAADLVETALNDRSAPIPLLIRLGKWTDADQSLPDFIAGQLGDLGTHLKTLLSEKRAALLLDGLNELPANQHQTKYPQVQRFIQQQPDLLAVVSCRELDYTLDLGFDKINIIPLDPLRIREFVGRYLGATKGEELFWKLAGKEAKQYYERYLIEFDQHQPNVLEHFWGIEGAHRDDGNNFIIFEKWGHRNRTWDAWLKVRDQPTSLMRLARNPYMLLMLISVYAAQGDLPSNRGNLFREFLNPLLVREQIASRDSQTRHIQLTQTAYDLLFSLEELAYQMQIQRGQLDDDGALVVLPLATARQQLSEHQVYLAGSANILDIGDDVRFTHQLLQEYFVALALHGRVFGNFIPGRAYARGEPMSATEIWKPANWWERTNWEEAAILLAGLYNDDPTPVVKWLLDAQPEIAAQCILRSGANLPPDETLLLFRDLIARLTDLKRDPDPRARAAVGRALGQLRLSTGELLDNRQGVGVIIKDGINLPDIDWVRIPAGEFTYQDGKMSLDYDYEIARYPITYAQFQTFMDDPKGYQDIERWFEGLAANEDDQVIREQYFRYWNHPRETINWYQAMTFCRWLSWRLEGGDELDKLETWAVRLPTEFEWEKAARANTGWAYPWGQGYQQGFANIDETFDLVGQYDLGQTSAVGIYPVGDTPHWGKSISDLSGNVWEWCLTDYENPQVEISRENIRSNGRRVRRGGSWLYDQNLASAMYRDWVDPFDRSPRLGFRLCRPSSWQL